MKFSIKAQQLQPAENNAALFVCDARSGNAVSKESGLVSALTARLQQEEHDFVAAEQLQNGQLSATAVWCVRSDDYVGIQKTADEAAAWAVKQKAVAIDVSTLNQGDAEKVVETFAIAAEQAAYRFDDLKQEAKPAALREVEFYAGKHTLQATLAAAEATIYGMNLCKTLGNTPSNICTPKYLADYAKAAAEAVGVQATILDSEAIQQLGMGSFWSVAKGSEQGAYLIDLRYNGAPNPTDAPIVLVGKGITFDSGGISLKPGAGMDEMKFDMCGAATVISTLCAAAKLKLPLNIVAIAPTCENMPSDRANKPGDVVKSMKGLSIEVLNTDAEGRLILCDALTYAERFHPKAVIDVATLTGACIIALGHVASGVLGNNQQLVDELLAAGSAVNDKIWQLPLFDEYKEQLQSNFADVQNIGGRPAGTITAAAFLSYFADQYAWAHLDIAGTAWKSGKEKGATGRPIPALLRYLCNQVTA